MSFLPPAAERRPGKAEVTILAVILVVGALLRWGYLAELRHAPDLAHPPVDAGFTLYWATGLATGDWTLPPDARGRDPGVGERAYLRPPGYPFVLAGLHRLTGGDPLAIRALQMLAGLLNAALAWLLGRLLLGPAVGLVWAALMACQWTFVLFEGTLQDAWLLVTLLLALMLLLHSFAVTPSAPRAAAAAATAGLVALVRPNMLVVLPLLAVWGWWVTVRHQRQPRLPALAAAAAALTLVLAPSTLRNLLVEGRWVPVSANGGLTLYVGNNDAATGVSSSEVAGLGRFATVWEVPEVVARLEREVGRELTFTDASRELGRRAQEWIQANPRRFAALTLRRAALFWGPHEVAHNHAVAAERNHSSLLRRLPTGFSVALAGALVGLLALLVGHRGRGVQEGWNLPTPARATLVAALLFVLAWSASFLPFFVASLYRVPVIPFLLLGCAVLAVHVARLARRRPVAAAAWVAVAVGTWLVARTPLVEVGSDLPKWHTQRGLAWAWQGRPDRAEGELRAALAAEPRSAPAHTALGALLFNSGRTTEAEDHFRAALTSVPSDPVALFNLGLALAGRGAWTEAREAFDRVTASEPTNAEAAANLGVSLERLGHRAEAADAYRRALTVDPDHRVATNNLAWLLSTAPEPELRDGRQAVRLAERQAAADPLPAVLDTLAAAYAEEGRFVDAVATAERALAALAQPDDPLAPRLAARLEGYRRGEPYRER